MLNQKLFDALTVVFGAPGPAANEGKAGTYSLPQRKSVCFSNKQVEYAQVQDWGECYRFCCPICGDTRNRLYFSHMFGTKLIPAKQKSPIYFGKKLAHCFNEGCHRKPEFLTLVQQLDALDIAQVTILGSDEKPVQKTFTKYLEVEAELPSPNYPIISDDLPGCVHTFLEKRRFDAQELDDLYMCRFVPQGATWSNKEYQLSFKEDRILIPIMQRRKLISWQARRIVDVQGDHKKYLFEPHCKAAKYLYNMDRAWKFRNVVICEGVTDVWRIGEDVEKSISAVALFGKTMSKDQMDIMKVLWGYDGKGFVLLDADAVKERRAIYKFLTAYKIFPRGVELIELDSGDPADCSRKDLVEYLSARIENKV